MTQRWIIIRSILWTLLFTLAITQLVYGSKNLHEFKFGRTKSMTEINEFIKNYRGQTAHTGDILIIDLNKTIPLVPNVLSRIYASQLLVHYATNKGSQIDLWRRLQYEINPGDFYKCQSVNTKKLMKIDIIQNFTISIFLIVTSFTALVFRSNSYKVDT